MSFFTFLARRFVAGKTCQEAVKVCRRLNGEGIAATLDFLGEEVRERRQATQATQEYKRLLHKIAEAEVDANISLKLTQLGLSVEEDFCRQNLEEIVREAQATDNFVRIDMEGSAYTQKTLDIFYRLFERYKNVGAVIQAYLHRSQEDIERLNRLGARVRLCKGAYRESPEIACQSREEVSRNFDLLARRLLEQGNQSALATHDEERIWNAIDFARQRSIAKASFELQMLYGLRVSLGKELVRRGYRFRMYVPYGTHWFSYFYRRLRERKENVAFVFRSLLRE
ncbi:MAG: proline dehydrogenase family protein [Elusimicrobia bacterium]|nr:proline dehydrogenase family protein [Elusimicrobiota bacterium]